MPESFTNREYVTITSNSKDIILNANENEPTEGTKKFRNGVRSSVHRQCYRKPKLEQLSNEQWVQISVQALTEKGIHNPRFWVRKANEDEARNAAPTNAIGRLQKVNKRKTILSGYAYCIATHKEIVDHIKRREKGNIDEMTDTIGTFCIVPEPTSDPPLPNQIDFPQATKTDDDISVHTDVSSLYRVSNDYYDPINNARNIVQENQSIERKRKLDQVDEYALGGWRKWEIDDNTIFYFKKILDPFYDDDECQLMEYKTKSEFLDRIMKRQFEKFQSWVNNSTQHMFTLSEPAGFGKSPIAYELVKRYRNDNIIAWHFAQENCSTRNDPKRMLSSLAYQIALNNEEYRTKLFDVIKTQNLTKEKLFFSNDYDIKAIFDELLYKPLYGITSHKNYAILIDGLDKCEKNGKNDLLECIKTYFDYLPSWLKVCCTTAEKQ